MIQIARVPGRSFFISLRHHISLQFFSPSTTCIPIRVYSPIAQKPCHRQDYDLRSDQKSTSRHLKLCTRLQLYRYLLRPSGLQRLLIACQTPNHPVCHFTTYILLVAVPMNMGSWDKEVHKFHSVRGLPCRHIFMGYPRPPRTRTLQLCTMSPLPYVRGVGLNGGQEGLTLCPRKKGRPLPYCGLPFLLSTIVFSPRFYHRRQYYHHKIFPSSCGLIHL